MHGSDQMAENTSSILTGKLTKLWIRAHGYEKAKARMLKGHERLVAIAIDDAFTPAEIGLTNEPRSRSLIEEYAELLIALIKPEIISCVDDLFGCKVIGCWISPHVSTGSLLCLFQFENELSERFG